MTIIQCRLIEDSPRGDQAAAPHGVLGQDEAEPPEVPLLLPPAKGTRSLFILLLLIRKRKSTTSNLTPILTTRKLAFMFLRPRRRISIHQQISKTMVLNGFSRSFFFCFLAPFLCFHFFSFLFISVSPRSLISQALLSVAFIRCRGTARYLFFR